MQALREEVGQLHPAMEAHAWGPGSLENHQIVTGNMRVPWVTPGFKKRNSGRSKKNKEIHYIK